MKLSQIASNCTLFLLLTDFDLLILRKQALLLRVIPSIFKHINVFLRASGGSTKRKIQENGTPPLKVRHASFLFRLSNHRLPFARLLHLLYVLGH